MAILSSAVMSESLSYCYWIFWRSGSDKAPYIFARVLWGVNCCLFGGDICNPVGCICYIRTSWKNIWMKSATPLIVALLSSKVLLGGTADDV